MDNILALKILLGVILFSLLILIYCYIKLSKLKKIKKIGARKTRSSEIFIDIYNILNKTIFIRKYLKYIKRNIKLIDLSDENTINKKASKFLCLSIFINLLISFVLLRNIDGLYFLLLSFMVLYIINSELLRFFIDRIENNLLVQFEVFLSEVKHYYHNHKMIDEAIYDTTKKINKNNYEMSLHAKKMYEILISENVDIEIENYYDEAPNRFFKNFIALSNLVQKFGDKRVDDKSAFLTNINYLKQEIKYELLKKSRLNYLFKSLSIIAIVPVFFVKYLEKWATLNLPELKYYFNGTYGFIIQILIFILVILSYELINKMKFSKNKMSFKNEKILKKIFKIKIVNNFLNILINKRYSKYLNYKKKLKNSGYNISVKEFYFKRVLIGIICFILTILVFININYISKKAILGVENTKITQLDNKYILGLKDTRFTKKELEIYLDKNENFTSKELDIVSKRLYKKIMKYKNIYFKWWFLIIAIINSIIGYNLLPMFLSFKKKVMIMNIEDEVIQLHTIILMLIHFERISVEDVLHWMENFSHFFKPSIKKCLNEIDVDDIKALENLKKEESYPAFVKIVDNLINASEKITLALAFDELILERNYYQEKRKQDNEMLIEKKGMLGKIIAFIPIGFTILFYLLVPFLLLSFRQLVDYSDQIKSVI